MTWEDVPESEGTNVVRLAMSGEREFFRLAKGRATAQWRSGLIAWWPGDGDTSDIVGGHDGLLRGDATFAEGVVGQAFSLDGDGDFVEVADAPELNFGEAAFTVTVWVTLSQCNQEQVIIEKLVHGAIPHPGWGLTWLGSGSLCFFDFPVVDVVDQAPGVPVRTWVHLVARWTGEEAAIFLDGAIVASESWPTDLSFDSPSSLKIGHRGNPNDTPGSESWQEFYLNGLVDEVMRFNRAVSDEEIRGICEAGIAGRNSGPR